VGYLKDGRIITASLDKTIKVWSPEGGLKATFTGHQADYLTCAAVARSGTLLASGGFDKTARLWDADSGSIAVFTGHEGAVQSVSLSSDSKTVASGSSDRTIRLWDVETKAPRKVISGHNATVEALAFSPTANLLAS